VNNSLREQFGKRNVNEVVSGDRSLIMDVVQQATDEQAREIGVEVIDVRLKRVDLVEEVSETVYRRMEASGRGSPRNCGPRARGSGADTFRCGSAAPDHGCDAERDAQVLRGQGDAEATRIYAEAFGRDQSSSMTSIAA
jgi:modulator of FtsH protease HflC